MNAMRKAAYRVYQRGMHLGMYLIPWPEPEHLPSMDAIPDLLGRLGLNRPLVVTDQGLVSAGLLTRLTNALQSFDYVVYDAVVPNPTLDNIDAAHGLYRQNGCDCLIALGGGSPMDCAKGVGARVARPNKPLSKMRGQLKVNRRIPPLVAIPTTAGTGSEATLAAVVTDARTHEKYAINDPVLIPRYAVLDPALTLGLPPSITATTGMDALTHAVEAFIGHSSTQKTRACSIEAIQLIRQHLLNAYQNGEDITARSGMLRASYLAGVAFTRAYVGYVHAIAHQLGALYGMPHGLANAILLPHVLRYYGDAAVRPLAKLYEAFGGNKHNESDSRKAAFIIDTIDDWKSAMDLPDKVSGIREEDIPRIVDGAAREANPLYPVPRIYDKHELRALVEQVRA